MKKNVPLYILLIFLIIVNVFFLFNYLGKPDHDRPGGKQDGFIVRELKFDDVQKQKFEVLKTEHFVTIEEFLDDEKKLKDDLFDRISNETISKTQIDSITSRIGKIVKARELETFYHFRAIQNICDDEQKEKLARIVKQAIGRKGPNNPNQSPPDRRRKGEGPPPRH